MKDITIMPFTNDNYMHNQYLKSEAYINRKVRRHQQKLLRDFSRSLFIAIFGSLIVSVSTLYAVHTYIITHQTISTTSDGYIVSLLGQNYLYDFGPEVDTSNLYIDYDCR